MIYFCIRLFAFIALLTSTIKAQRYSSYSDDCEETDSELVFVDHSIRGNSLPEIVIQITNRGIESKFILQSSDGFFAGKDTKIWLANNVGGKLNYRRQWDIMEHVDTTFYHDRKTRSAIAHTVNKDGISEFNGVINSDKIIQSLSNRDRKRRHVSSKLRHESLAQNASKNYHLLHKRNAPSWTNNNHYHTTNRNNYFNRRRNYYMTTPKIVYPEILVYVDKTVFEHHNKDIVKTVAYVLTIFNGVDLYFRDIENPSIRLSIAGIVLCEDLINRRLLNGKNINSDVLWDFGRFLYSENQFKVSIDYDVAIYLLKPIDSGRILGISPVGTVCKTVEMRSRVESMLVAADRGKLDGISTVAHELGHLFGTRHDNDTVQECHHMKGFVMSYNIYDQNQFFFSPCSIEKMKWCLSQDTAQCIRNNPADKRTDNQILRVLPGQYMTLDEQCQKYGYRHASVINIDTCLELTCTDGVQTIYVDVAALEGTPCDFGKYCLRGECVNVPLKNSDKNTGLSHFFSIEYKQRRITTNAKDHCQALENGLVLKAFYDICKLKCVILGLLYYYSKESIAIDGIPCNNNGVCFRGECIDDEYRLADDYCKKHGEAGFFKKSAIRECTFICKRVSYNVSKGFREYGHDKKITFIQINAPNGYACRDSGHCQHGRCIYRRSYAHVIDSNTFVDKRYGQFASSIKRCKQVNMEWKLDYNFGCVTLCESPTTEPKHFNADWRLPCSINGVCENGQCVLNSTSSTRNTSSTSTISSTSITSTTSSTSITSITSSTSSTSSTTSTSRTIIASTSSVVDSSTSSTILPFNFISPINQCHESGLVNFVSLDKFDCTVVCSNATDFDYDEDKDNTLQKSDANIYQDISRPDGIACKYDGHCLNGECANMSTINFDEKEKTWSFDELKIFKNNKRRVTVEGVKNDSKLLNEGENKEQHNVPIDLSDIDDDVKEFADNIEVDI